MGEREKEPAAGAETSREDETRLPPEVVRCLDGYRSRARKFAVVKGAAVTVTAYLALVVVMALLDRFVRMPVWLRAMLSFGSMSGMAAFAYYVLLSPVFHRPGARRAALELERRDPSFNEALVTTVDHLAGGDMPRGASAALVSEVARGSAGVAGGIKLPRVLPARLLKRIMIAAAIAVAVFGGLFAVPGLGFARLVARFHAPFANLPRASLVRIAVEPGSVVVGTGDPVEIRAIVWAPAGAEGREAASACLHVKLEGESWAESEMAASPELLIRPEGAPGEEPRSEFTRTIGTVAATFDYYVTAGDAESAAFRVVAVDRPLPELFRATYVPPEYTGAAAQTEEGPTGAVRGLKGSRVTVSVKPSVPVTKASLVKDGFAIPMAVSEDGMLATSEFDLQKDGAYSLLLQGEHGLTNRQGREYPIRALDDVPPAVTAGLLHATSRVDPEGVLCVRYEAKDDWGVRTVASLSSLNGAEPAPKNVPVRKPGRSTTGDFLVDLKSLGAGRGDHVSVVVSARDSLDQEGRSREIMVWLGRDLAARRAAERAERIAAAAEAVRDMAEIREALDADTKGLAELLKQDGWSAERERKLADLRRLERRLQAKAERARHELLAARGLSEDDLARALSVASRRLLRSSLASERLDEALAQLDTADQDSREGTVEALERAQERAPLERELAGALERISTGEHADAALEEDAALAERRGKLEEIGRGEMTPAREEFLRREEKLMAEDGQDLREDVRELGLNVDEPQWKDRAREIAERGELAAAELAARDDIAQQIAAVAEEANELVRAEAPLDPADAEAAFDAMRDDMDALEAELAEAAADEDALNRPDFALARDDDLTRAALEGIERRNLEEAAPEAGAREAAGMTARELTEAAEARQALEAAAAERTEQAGREQPDAEALEAAEREAEKARDTLARLAGDPAEALERLAAREEELAGEAAEADAGPEAAEGREDLAALAALADTQAHLADEAARLAERLMHEANAETAAPEPDTERIEALDDLREGIEELVQGDMNAAAEALAEAALGEEAAAEQAAQMGAEAAEELARLAAEAREMAQQQAAAEAGEPGDEAAGEDAAGEEAPADQALAALEEMAGLEAAQRELAAETGTSDAKDAAEGARLSQEQQALGERTQEAMEAMQARQEQLEAAQQAALDAAGRAEELAEAAEAVAGELAEAADAAAAEPEAGEVAGGAEELAGEVGQAAEAMQAALPEAAPAMQAAAQSTAQAAEQAQAGHQSTQQAQAQPGVEQFAQAAENLQQAAEDLAQAAAAAETALAPEAGQAMQEAVGEQNAAANALPSTEQAARTQAHQSQMAAAEALAEARQQMAQSINSARMAQSEAMQPAQAQSAQAQPAEAQAQAMAAGGVPGVSDGQSDGRVVGTAPADDGSDWGRLRETEDASEFAEREGIAANYAEAIRLYFEAVAREGRRE